MYYIIVFIVLFALELLYFKIADRYNIIDRPNERSSHSRITLRGGGVVFYLGAVVWFVVSEFRLPWFMAGLTAITLISFVDDLKSVSSKVRLLVHFTAMCLMFWQWGLTGTHWWYIPVALIFCTGIINAYNFMDGINGITGGYSLVVLAALGYINQYVIGFTDNRLIAVMLLAVLVFIFFNFRKKAKCFAGDVGSVSIAFVLLFLLGQLVLKTGDLSYLVLLAVYGVDSVLTVVHRLILKENITKPHRKHLYQLMANELKVPHIVVSLSYMFLQTIVIIGYLWWFEYRWFYFASTVSLLSVGYYFFMKRYFHLHTVKYN